MGGWVEGWGKGVWGTGSEGSEQGLFTNEDSDLQPFHPEISALIDYSFFDSAGNATTSLQPHLP